MLYIDDKKLEVTKQTISIGNYTKNGKEGYNINIYLAFINIATKENGYINLDVGFEKDNNINNFLNKEYKGNLFQNSSDDIYLEVFDTEKFLDSEIESNITVKLKNKIDNKVNTYIEVNDELIKIKFLVLLNIEEKNYIKELLNIKNNEDWDNAKEYEKDEEW